MTGAVRFALRYLACRTTSKSLGLGRVASNFQAAIKGHALLEAVTDALEQTVQRPSVGVPPKQRQGPFQTAGGTRDLSQAEHCPKATTGTRQLSKGTRQRSKGGMQSGRHSNVWHAQQSKQGRPCQPGNTCQCASGECGCDRDCAVEMPIQGLAGLSVHATQAARVSVRRTSAAAAAAVNVAVRSRCPRGQHPRRQGRGRRVPPR